jgi:hypothetical protein
VAHEAALLCVHCCKGRVHLKRIFAHSVPSPAAFEQDNASDSGQYALDCANGMYPPYIHTAHHRYPDAPAPHGHAVRVSGAVVGAGVMATCVIRTRAMFSTRIVPKGVSRTSPTRAVRPSRFMI